MNSKTKHIIGYTVTAVAAIGIGSAAASGGSGNTVTGATPAVTQTVAGDEGTPAATVTVTPPAETVTPPAETVTVTATPTAAGGGSANAGATIPGDGTYEVGVDVQPGRYTSTTPDSGNCYWARLKSADGFDGIIANNNSSGQSVVVIKASDKFFESSGCNDWTAR
ncbi:hypothetical protein [Luteipulveratus flavus]|uniref:Uncharacterized protein n=1 Tax=Luteipulveratus flavus TaxID=3031728 RepID=A0ABT6C4D0_9MICO|nr:hypothetical protein [Luteipulveratus sp. YIM 133296]MDF8263735.1 hypothetical protein [Luteipulveratus sp. YIM 133296]